MPISVISPKQTAGPLADMDSFFAFSGNVTAMPILAVFPKQTGSKKKRLATD